LYTLTENQTKDWLTSHGFPVPKGASAATPDEAAEIARSLGGGAVVKALVPTGRRGKAGAIRMAETPKDVAAAASAIIASAVHGFTVEKVYVEAQVEIADELYLGFSLDSFPPRVLVSRHGGVDIEETHRVDAGSVIDADIDPRHGLSTADAEALWRRAGVDDVQAGPLAVLTSNLYATFKDADAVTLEINPLAVTGDGELSLVGAMMAIDENGLSRHPDWAAQADGSLIAAWRRFNERELRVAEANREIKGGAVRYTELDGDIGLLVGGGGAGLLQHDLMLAAGGRPANHTDTNPGAGIKEKIKTVVGAILDNPNTNCLLVGFNHQQLTRCDQKVEPLVQVLDARQVDCREFPIVIRLVGPGEEEARALVADRPGIHYMPTEASLDDAVREIVAINRKLTGAIA
jgi:succinyl-CoA synthetase beta subunit